MNIKVDVGNVGALGIVALTISFVVLRLCNVINWHWGWVVSPLWLPVVCLVTVMAASMLYLFLRLLCERIYYLIWPNKDHNYKLLGDE